MTFIIIFAMVLLGAGMANITIDEERARTVRLLQGAETEETTGLALKKRFVIGITVFLGLISGVCTWRILDITTSRIDILRLIIILLALIGSGCMDLREKRIPNIFPAVLSVGGIALIAVGFVADIDGASGYLISSVVAAGGCALAMLLISLLTKNGIGAGDIKLLCSLGLMGGVYVLCGTIFWGVIICAVSAAVLLLTRKKGKEDALPFGPFILTGYVISVFISNF